MSEKVKLTIILEIPVGDRDKRSLECVTQNIFDDFINYAVVKHLSDALAWNKEQSISGHHELWADIIRRAEKTMTIEEVE